MMLALDIIVAAIAACAVIGSIKDLLDQERAIKTRDRHDRETRAHESRIIAEHEAHDRTETEEQ